MASYGMQSHLLASQPSTGGASRQVTVNHGSVSVAASLPAADLCHIDRGDPPDGALLLHRRHPSDPCACRIVARTFANLDAAAPHSLYPNFYCGAYVHAHDDTDTHRDAETGSQRHFYRYYSTYPDIHALSHTYAHCHGHSYQHPDANKHAHRHADAVSHADPHSHLDTDWYGYAQPNAEPDTERHAYAKSDTDRYVGNGRPTASIGSRVRGRYG